MKIIMTLCAMLSFTALNTKAVAQTYRKLSKDSVIVTEAWKTDTMRIEDVLLINDSYPLDKRVKRNTELFREMRKQSIVKSNQ